MNIWKGAFDSLKGEPSAGLAGIAVIAGVVLLTAGFGPWLSIGFPGGMYFLYLLKGLFDNRHERNLAELEVQKLEAGRGQKVRNMTQRSLTRRRSKNATP